MFFGGVLGSYSITIEPKKYRFSRRLPKSLDMDLKVCQAQQISQRQGSQGPPRPYVRPASDVDGAALCSLGGTLKSDLSPFEGMWRRHRLT